MFKIRGVVVRGFTPSTPETEAVQGQPGLHSNMLCQNLLSVISHPENASQSKMECQTSRCENITT